MRSKWLPVVMGIVVVQGALAFDGHEVTEGPLRMEIQTVERVTQTETPYYLRVVLANADGGPLEVQLRISGLVDPWRVVGEAQRPLSLSAGGRQEVLFQIAVGPGAYSALYPVHCYATFSHAGQERTAHAVRILETQFAAPAVAAGPASELPVTNVPLRGGLLLTEQKNFRVGWAYFDQPDVFLPTGWQGEAQPSRASFAIRPATRGTTRSALNMHPAWSQGRGVTFVDYRLRLPQTTPIACSFGNAIRDATPPEPPSDGVTFRVRVDDQVLLEAHTDSRTWVDGEVDLSPFAGREIRLRLECHPGPQRDTTCDSAYWGDPMITVGQRPQPTTPEQQERLRQRARTMVETGRSASPGEFLLPLADGLRVAVVLGRSGLIDGVIGLGEGQACVVLDGINASVHKHRLSGWPPTVAVVHVDVQRGPSDSVRVVHRCTLADEDFDLTAELAAEAGGVRIRLECPERITDLAPGRLDRTARRVYYGHGYCIDRPQPFQVGYGGHNLSTSHVGMDFDNGLSLLTACDNPPDYFEVNPSEGVYALHTHMSGTLTLVPSLRGAIDCARSTAPWTVGRLRPVLLARQADSCSTCGAGATTTTPGSCSG